MTNLELRNELSRAADELSPDPVHKGSAVGDESYVLVFAPLGYSFKLAGVGKVGVSTVLHLEEVP